MNFQKIEEILENEPKYRNIQAKSAIFKELISDWSQVLTFSKTLRGSLNKEAPLTINHQLFPSKDQKTVKALIEFEDGCKIEAVLMRHKDRNTVCVSSQVGCSLNCAFCATGKMGFTRNLSHDEIVQQILLFARYLKQFNQQVTNIVFMGMGEPFLNYDNVLSAIRYLNQADTMNLGARRFSISTSGITEGISRFAQEDLSINLALSLHSADDDLRSRLMPINRKYPLSEVLPELKKYQTKTRRKIMFEYIMIADVNDSINHAQQLANIVKDFICVVNLIPCNPASSFRPSSRAAIEKFTKILQSNGIEVVQRFNYGHDVSGSCGQLATDSVKNEEKKYD